jgi:lauroyl/myristoyl acyltransferase
MVDTGDVAQDVIRNARRVLTELEGLIQRNPEQWMMFVPVWQDA